MKTGFNATVLCHSKTEFICKGSSLTEVEPRQSELMTMELTYPRIIHSEFMTHRAFSRNAASSRAIPVEKMIKAVEEHPFVPIHWGAAQKGMQAYEEVNVKNKALCKFDWLGAAENAIVSARTLLSQGLHKQIANRLLEPWMWITVIATGNRSSWSNFFHLRCAADAEPHIQNIANQAKDAYLNSTPKVLRHRDSHLPLLSSSELSNPNYSPTDLKKISVGRCARVSYLTHDGVRDCSKDIELHDRLLSAGHWSPFEHVATVGITPDGSNKRYGNLGIPWVQYRKQFPTECVTDYLDNAERETNEMS